MDAKASAFSCTKQGQYVIECIDVGVIKVLGMLNVPIIEYQYVDR